MAVDSYAQLWGRVLATVPASGPLLSQRWTVDAFRRIAERRRWSWLVKWNQFILPAAYSTGTCTVTQNSAIVTGSGTTWTAAMVGRQFRIGTSTPIYTIAQVDSSTQLQLQLPWGGTTASAAGYSIYLCYVTPPPDDFFNLISVWDPNFNWQLGLNVTQNELNAIDSQRANMGQAYVLANYDYSQNSTGFVSAPVEIIGSGSGPSIAGSASYTGPANALFTVQLTLGGAAGTATYRWNKNNGAFTTVTTDGGGASQDLSDGVAIFFPVGPTYVLGDTFVIRTSVTNSPGLPRYELWPHNLSNYVYPFLYEARAQDLNEPGAVLPRYIRGDVVVDSALMIAAQWPGPDPDHPNVFFDLNLADRIKQRVEYEIGQLEKQDDSVYEDMVSYASSLPFAPFYDSKFLQNHAF